VFLNGVSYAHELGYRDIVEDWERSGEYPVDSSDGLAPDDRRTPTGLGGRAALSPSSAVSSTSWA